MSNRFRGLAAAVAMTAVLIGHAAPVSAAFIKDSSERQTSVPIVMDAIFLRPVGLTLTVLGAGVYAAFVAPVTALTRPKDIGKPLGPLVIRPAKFTFVDPLGQHP
jgi:hypothetical protein